MLKSFASDLDVDAMLQFVEENFTLADSEGCICCAASALDIAWLLAVQESRDLLEPCYYHF